MLTLKCLSQIGFEKGYFIDKNENKTECLIRNIGYLNATKNLSYKLAEKTKTKTTDLSDIKEIVIYGFSKYVRRYVDIGKPNELNERNRNYIFKSEELWLKVLVEGEASLYSYRESGNHFFFYGLNDIQTEQLIFKTYISETGIKKINNSFKRQLFENLTCESITFEYANGLKHNKEDLTDFFIKFNGCKNSNNVVYYRRSKDFNVSLRPRLSNVSMVINERGSLNDESFDFGNQILFGFGIEAEMQFPFTGNKWALSLEPTYQGKFNAQLRSVEAPNIVEIAEVNYVSFDIPLTLRHYSYINENSKIFLNTSVVYAFSGSSNFIEFKVKNEVSGGDAVTSFLKPSSSINLAFGGGYKFKNKYGVEVRWNTKRNVINHLISHTSSYNMLSIIFGYAL